MAQIIEAAYLAGFEPSSDTIAAEGDTVNIEISISTIEKLLN